MLNNYQISHDNIEIDAKGNTDLWSQTCWPQIKDDAERKFFSDFSSPKQVISVDCSNDLINQYDQLGIISYLDIANWIKFCVEKEPDGLYICCVVTKDGYSDCSYHPAAATARTQLFLEREGNFIRMGYINSADGHKKALRVSHNFFPPQTKIGLFAASPGGRGFIAKFYCLSITNEV